jgi:hypothetical protein
VKADVKAERRVWDLLTRDFYWQIPPDLAVKEYGTPSVDSTPGKFQIFEVVVAAIFARLRPEYDWYVTPNRPDGGVDFVGKQRFLEDEVLGIAAAITVGGQCKKRSRVDDIVDVVGSSLMRMAETLNPTFFVVALSAHLSADRVERARETIERIHHRHCHILDRRQIEGLICDHFDVVREILHAAINDKEEQLEVVAYFEAYRRERAAISIEVAAPDRVLAGVPFRVSLLVRIPRRGSCLRWRSRVGEGADDPLVLIGPVGADSPSGFELADDDVTDDPLRIEQALELVTYTVGTLDLGEIRVDGNMADSQVWIPLGSVQVVENLRPRFFERPFRGGLTRLADQYERALGGGLASIGVVGAGGSGKSRMCEEFALERRRRGSAIVSAKQAKTLDDPHRVLADLFVGLTGQRLSHTDPADDVLRTIELYDGALAARAEPSLRSIFGLGGERSGTVTDQSILSSLLLLIVARSRRGSLIVHLQDLHWCTADVLMLLERLVWQLGLVLTGPNAPVRGTESGVLFVFEGRARERQHLGDGGWVSEPFEAFLQKLDCPVVTCASFTPEDGLEFISRLFEDRYSSRRRGSSDLLELQRQLVERIDRTAGGNPFHSLEQVQLLKERGVLGQNQETGLLYLIRPESVQAELPSSVFEAIRLRWQDITTRTPELGLLIWAAGLLEDRLPTPLFRRLWRTLAPDVALADVDATDVLWTGSGAEREVAFRHENYFQAVKLFEVSDEDRERVVDIYVDWFGNQRRGDPADRFRRARALLERPRPDMAQVQRILRSARQGAQRSGDLQLERRIATTTIDLTWSRDAGSPIPLAQFVRWCDDDLAVTRELLEADRSQAARRLAVLSERIEQRLEHVGRRSARRRVEVQRRQLTAEVLRTQVLFNDRQPAKASEIAGEVAWKVHTLRPGDTEEQAAWNALEMETLHSHGVALALSGEIDESLARCEQAVTIARKMPSLALAHHVISTYANILLARDPAASEAILRQCEAELAADPKLGGARDATDINLGMALVLKAYRLKPLVEQRDAMLDEAAQLLTRVFTDSFQFGDYAHAGAAALMLGIVSALREDGNGDAVSWFAQAVAASARGRQMETLWRAHSNLAAAMFRNGETVEEGVRDHARAAVEILEETLSPYPQPDRSARFRLILVPLAQAVSFLVRAGDEAGLAVLERYPALRPCFQDPRAGVLKDDRGGHTSHEWLRIDRADYVLY